MSTQSRGALKRQALLDPDRRPWVELEELPTMSARFAGVACSPPWTCQRQNRQGQTAVGRPARPACVLRHAFADGLIFRAFADGSLGFAPALTCTEMDVDVLVTKLRRAVHSACSEVF